MTGPDWISDAELATVRDRHDHLEQDGFPELDDTDQEDK